MDPILNYELSGGVATLTMNDGKANVMSVRMLQELSAAFDRAQADKAVVLLTSGGRLFSGGFDLAVFKSDRAELFRMLEAGALLTQKMLAFPRPIVAVCAGHAIAMGVFLMLGADVRIGVDEGARIQVNEVQIGLTVPHFAIEICRHRLAPQHLHHAVGTAAPHTPQQALQAGFLTELAAAASIGEAGRSSAKAVAALHAGAFADTKARLTQHTRAAMEIAVREDIEDWSRAFLKRE
ncbi:MAG: crotonase/enoyl-CoA hydratase family protein [Sinimarinibacterium sp.]|jgi:enoyl-CoA hydratase